MRQMNSTAKTLACRIAFIILVALPTFGTLSYVACGIWRPIEMTPAAWSSLLSEKTGLEIRIGSMRRDGTGVFVLEQFEVRDPETSAIWITSTRAEVTMDGSSLRLELREMVATASALRPLAEHFQHRVLKGRREGFQPLRLHAEQGKLQLSDARKTLMPIAQLEIWTKLEEGGPAAEAEIELTDEEEPVWISLVAERMRQEGDARTHYKWKVDGTAGISTSLLAELSPQWSGLGEFARFRGQAEGDETNYTLSGIEFRDIDLTQLGERWGISGLTGIASLGGERRGDSMAGARIEFRNGEFTDLFGEIRVDSGTIDSRLLTRLARSLPLEVEGDLANRSHLEFSAGAIRLELQGEYLKMTTPKNARGVLERNGARVVWLRTPVLRNARELTGELLSEVHSEGLPVSQWVAAMPTSRNAEIPTTAKKPKSTKSR
jgi:hypothetical protein